MNIAGVFAGIAGFELGFERAGHRTNLLCEKDELAVHVLKQHFPHITIHNEVETLTQLPKDTDVVCAGFPCQNLSMVGDKKGLAGGQSSLVDHLFRLLEVQRINHVVIENVYFMLHLHHGAAVKYIVNRLERLGYSWAYRVVDSRAFSLAQRRRRLFIVASTELDPRRVLFADDKPNQCWPNPNLNHPIGFYWTEGISGHGLTGDAIPPLKVGSGIGIPSPPAVLLPNGRVVTPTVETAEILQGFPRDWTKSLEPLGMGKHRWRFLGNAVSVPVAKWLGERLLAPGTVCTFDSRRVEIDEKWTRCGWNVGDGAFCGTISEYPQKLQRARLSSLEPESWMDISTGALEGFVKRAKNSRLRYPAGFLDHLEAELNHRTAQFNS